MIKKLLLFALALVISSCSSGEFKKNFFKSSPRESYERKLKKNEQVFLGWTNSHKKAILAPRLISIPHFGNGTFKSDDYITYSYTFSLKTGEVIDTQVLTDTLQCKVFITLFNSDDLSKIVHSNSTDDKHLRYSVIEDGTYVLTIQPEVAIETNCKVFINKEPLYSFPVANKGNNAIQSFWDAPRDNGQRRHEGVDIFAKKGTAVLAVTEGMVYDTGDKGLGGKQVWQRSGLLGNSIYYAHLDKVAVEAGTFVKVGDTLGYVGNTGNAKGGPDHLHFGIYGWNGAIDPLPFIYQTKQIKVPKL